MGFLSRTKFELSPPHLLSPEQILYTIGAAVILYVSGIIIYRLYLHPLAGYPGPLLARCTTLHAAYHAWVGDSHLVLYHAHRKYGSNSFPKPTIWAHANGGAGTFVRFTPNFVSINDAAAINGQPDFPPLHRPWLIIHFPTV